MPSVFPRNSGFRRLWIGQTASQLGEHSSLVILPLIAVLTLHVDAGQLGALRAVGQAPILLLSLFAGAWVDRWRTRTVMVLADLRRALVLAGAAVAVLLGGFGLPALLVIAFAIGALSVFSTWPTNPASLLATAAGMLLSPALMALSPSPASAGTYRPQRTRNSGATRGNAALPAHATMRAEKFPPSARWAGLGAGQAGATRLPGRGWLSSRANALPHRGRRQGRRAPVRRQRASSRYRDRAVKRGQPPSLVGCPTAGSCPHDAIEARSRRALGEQPRDHCRPLMLKVSSLIVLGNGHGSTW